MDFLDLLSNFGDLLGPFLVRVLNGDLISIKLANLPLKELYFYSNTSKGVCLPHQLRFKRKSISCRIAAKRELAARCSSLAPVKTLVRLGLEMTEQMNSKWAAIGLIRKPKS